MPVIATGMVRWIEDRLAELDASPKSPNKAKIASGSIPTMMALRTHMVSFALQLDLSLL